MVSVTLGCPRVVVATSLACIASSRGNNDPVCFSEGDLGRVLGQTIPHSGIRLCCYTRHVVTAMVSSGQLEITKLLKLWPSNHLGALKESFPSHQLIRNYLVWRFTECRKFRRWCSKLPCWLMGMQRLAMLTMRGMSCLPVMHLSYNWFGLVSVQLCSKCVRIHKHQPALRIRKWIGCLPAKVWTC